MMLTSLYSWLDCGLGNGFCQVPVVIRRKLYGWVGDYVLLTKRCPRTESRREQMRFSDIFP